MGLHILNWIAAVIGIGIVALPQQGFCEVPRGVFCLLSTGGVSNSIYDNPDVDGVSIRQNWSDLEPAENVYDWTYLDAAISQAAAASKPVLLRISSQDNKPAWVTTAIKQAGGTFYSFNDNWSGVHSTIPVFWDPTYLAKKKAMIRALGSHFALNPAIKIVGASFANSSSEDWSVPHDNQTQVSDWLAAGYTSAKMLDAGKQINDTTMAAFPTQYVSLAVAPNGHVGPASGANLDPDTDYVARNAIADARTFWPGRLIVQKDSLSAVTSKAPGTDTPFNFLWNNRPNVAGQMLWYCFGDQTYRNNHGSAADPTMVLRASVDAGLSYGMQYIEIYRADILSLPDVIKYAHNVLTGSSSNQPAPPTQPQGLHVGP